MFEINTEINTRITRKIVNFIVLIFVIITLFIVSLLCAYYTTPNNYIIYQFDETKFSPVNKQTEYLIKPNSNQKINLSEYNKFKIKFNTETNIVIKNMLKSQNVLLNSNDLIEIKYDSDIIIVNDTNSEKNIIMSLYK